MTDAQKIAAREREQRSMRANPMVRKYAETRAEECSDGTKTLEQLSALDREACWLAAEDDAVTEAERQMGQAG